LQSLKFETLRGSNLGVRVDLKYVFDSSSINRVCGYLLENCHTHQAQKHLDYEEDTGKYCTYLELACYNFPRAINTIYGLLKSTTRKNTPSQWIRLDQIQRVLSLFEKPFHIEYSRHPQKQDTIEVQFSLAIGIIERDALEQLKVIGSFYDFPVSLILIDAESLKLLKEHKVKYDIRKKIHSLSFKVPRTASSFLTVELRTSAGTRAREQIWITHDDKG